MLKNNKYEESHESVSNRLGSVNGFFYNLTGLFSKNITNGTKEVDEAINHSLLKVNKSLEMRIPFPTIVETQGNIFEYEDFPESRIEKELLEEIQGVSQLDFNP